jgi:hypothetical protein
MKRLCVLSVLAILFLIAFSVPAPAGNCEQSKADAENLMKAGVIKFFEDGFKDWYVPRVWNDMPWADQRKTAEMLSKIREYCDQETTIKIYDFETGKLLATYDGTGFHIVSGM